MSEIIFRAEASVAGGKQVVRLTNFLDDGTQKTKTISYDDFAAGVAKGVRQEGFTLGLLPEGTVWFSVNANSTKLAVRIKAKKRQLTYARRGEDALFVEVPYPDLILVLNIKEKAVCPEECFALSAKTGQLREDTELYVFPFGNVSTNGHVCMGGNHLAFTGGLAEAVEAGLQGFFYSPYNGDYYQPCSHISTGDSLGDALKKLSGMLTFPEEWLVPAKRNLKDILN